MSINLGDSEIQVTIDTSKLDAKIEQVRDLINAARRFVESGDIESAYATRKEVLKLVGRDADPPRPFFCRKCGAHLGHAHPGTLYLTTTYHTERYIGFCIQCGAKVRWYPNKALMESRETC